MPNENNHPLNTGFAFRPLDAERAHSALYKLLRLSPPDARYGEALQYLVQSHAHEPKHSAATISQWSYAQLANASRHWLYAGNSDTTVDEWLTALWVWEELQQCQTEPWLYSISHRLITNTASHQEALHTASGLPAEALTVETLNQWLRRMGITAPPFSSTETLAAASQKALLSVYLQTPFPWTALLKVVSKSSIACHPSVKRLQAQYHVWLEEEHKTWGVSSWEDRLDRLQNWANKPALFDNTLTEAPISLKATRCRPLKCALLVEGTSEVVLLPAIAHALGTSLSTHGIQLVSVGGKSLMMKSYGQLATFMSRPIMALLDADGAPEQHLLSQTMTAQNTHNQAVILPEGTLEDTLSDQLIADTLNRFYDPPEPLSALGIAERRSKGRHDNRTLSALETLFKDWELASSRKGSHKEKQFDKVDFAYHVAQTLLIQSSTITTHPVSQSLVAFIHQAVVLSQQNTLALRPPTEHG